MNITVVADCKGSRDIRLTLEIKQDPARNYTRLHWDGMRGHEENWYSNLYFAIHGIRDWAHDKKYNLSIFASGEAWSVEFGNNNLLHYTPIETAYFPTLALAQAFVKQFNDEEGDDWADEPKPIQIDGEIETTYTGGYGHTYDILEYML